MLIAQAKRKENIAEYLLYMWQVEDTLRACQLDEERINRLLVARYVSVEGITEETMKAIRQWYHDLAAMMLAEGKRDSGHLQINEVILADLTDLHQRLLKGGEDAIYTSAYYSTLPTIVELRARQGEHPQGELETCFTALYGILMLRLQGRDVSKETQAAIAQISKFIGLLAEKYKEDKLQNTL